MTNEQKQTILGHIRQQAIIELEQQVDEDCITEFDEADIEATISNLIDDCPDLIEPILQDVLGDIDDYDTTLSELFN